MSPSRRLSMEEYDRQFQRLRAGGAPLSPAGGSAGASGEAWPDYMAPLSKFLREGDRRLPHLKYDASPATMRLWSFLLSEEERLNAHRAAGRKIVGAMKDLGTVPVMASCLPDLVAFYPDGTWWVPCIMEHSSGDLEIADRLGVDESFCPVRAMLGAFVQEKHFPRPDLLVCSVGATCDDFSAISQRLSSLGFPVDWWEIPHRRSPEAGEEAMELPGGFAAPASQVAFVRGQLARVRELLERLSGEKLTDERLAEGIRQANRFRRVLDELRQVVYTAEPCPLGALEMLIVEMLAIHFCSDRDEALRVVEGLMEEVRERVAAAEEEEKTTEEEMVAGRMPARREGKMPSPRERPSPRAGDTLATRARPRAVRVFWVNPVADLRVMNLLEECGGRLAGTEFLFCHALDEIPEDVPPMEALARMALADPMVGPAADRAERICRDARRFGAQALLVSRIPGASHCASESGVIRRLVGMRLNIPAAEIEVPPVCDSLAPSIRTRLEALIESARARQR